VNGHPARIRGALQARRERKVGLCGSHKGGGAKGGESPKFGYLKKRERNGGFTYVRRRRNQPKRGDYPDI